MMSIQFILLSRQKVFSQLGNWVCEERRRVNAHGASFVLPFQGIRR